MDPNLLGLLGIFLAFHLGNLVGQWAQMNRHLIPKQSASSDLPPDEQEWRKLLDKPRKY